MEKASLKVVFMAVLLVIGCGKHLYLLFHAQIFLLIYNVLISHNGKEVELWIYYLMSNNGKTVGRSAVESWRKVREGSSKWSHGGSHPSNGGKKSAVQSPQWLHPNLSWLPGEQVHCRPLCLWLLTTDQNIYICYHNSINALVNKGGSMHVRHWHVLHLCNK